jgi:two-component system phosphate regulon response regulator PhoB
MSKPRILLVEDEKGLVQTLTWFLTKEGFEVIVAGDAPEALSKATSQLPELILLDLMLPGASGLDVLRELRNGEQTKDIPVIVVTAKAEENDQVAGFTTGADDYVTKPFSNKVLLQRIKVLLRRAEAVVESVENLSHLGIEIDRVRHKVLFEDKPLELTPTEFRLLECLLKQPGRAFSRNHLMDAAIGEGSIVLERTIDVHIKTLRRKLTEVGATGEWIETVRGVGYRLKEADEAQKMSKQS